MLVDQTHAGTKNERVFMQANVLFDTVKGRMGNANSSKYTGACFERWGCFSRRAVSVSFVDELAQTDEIVRIADALTDMSHINTAECVMRSMPVGGALTNYVATSGDQHLYTEPRIDAQGNVFSRNYRLYSSNI